MASVVADAANHRLSLESREDAQAARDIYAMMPWRCQGPYSLMQGSVASYHDMKYVETMMQDRNKTSEPSELADMAMRLEVVCALEDDLVPVVIAACLRSTYPMLVPEKSYEYTLQNVEGVQAWTLHKLVSEEDASSIRIVRVDLDGVPMFMVNLGLYPDTDIDADADADEWDDGSRIRVSTAAATLDSDGARALSLRVLEQLNNQVTAVACPGEVKVLPGQDALEQVMRAMDYHPLLGRPSVREGMQPAASHNGMAPP